MGRYREICIPLNFPLSKPVLRSLSLAFMHVWNRSRHFSFRLLVAQNNAFDANVEKLFSRESEPQGFQEPGVGKRIVFPTLLNTQKGLRSSHEPDSCLLRKNKAFSMVYHLVKLPQFNEKCLRKTKARQCLPHWQFLKVPLFISFGLYSHTILLQLKVITFFVFCH